MELLNVKFEGLDSAIVEIQEDSTDIIKEILKAIQLYNSMQKRIEELKENGDSI